MEGNGREWKGFLPHIYTKPTLSGFRSHDSFTSKELIFWLTKHYPRIDPYFLGGQLIEGGSITPLGGEGLGSFIDFSTSSLGDSQGTRGGEGWGVGDVGGLLRGVDVCFRFGGGDSVDNVNNSPSSNDSNRNNNNDIYSNNNTNSITSTNSVKNTNLSSSTTMNSRSTQFGGGEADGRQSQEGRGSGTKLTGNETWEGVRGGGWDWGEEELDSRKEGEINPFATFRELRPKDFPPAERLVPITCLNPNVSQFPDRFLFFFSFSFSFLFLFLFLFFLFFFFFFFFFFFSFSFFLFPFLFLFLFLFFLSVITFSFQIPNRPTNRRMGPNPRTRRGTTKTKTKSPRRRRPRRGRT